MFRKRRSVISERPEYLFLVITVSEYRGHIKDCEMALVLRDSYTARGLLAGGGVQNGGGSRYSGKSPGPGTGSPGHGLISMQLAM